MSTQPRCILALQGVPRLGVLAAITRFASDNGALIEASSVHNDIDAQNFFMRTVLRLPDAGVGVSQLRTRFALVGDELGLEWRLHDASDKPRILIAVSKFGHCLFDLMHRWRAGILPAEIVAVASNHEDMRGFVEWNGLPFHHLPVQTGARLAQERQLLDLVAALDVELLVLARYMQILSGAACAELDGRCINIHHSFLPSFQGANPYQRARQRGVKLIGATAHYVTTDLDEGPIIEQDVERVHHGHSAEELKNIGRDIECRVLARAVTWHVERRLFRNGANTVVFS
jgi:formyltetrahydrofolate deformylase